MTDPIDKAQPEALRLADLMDAMDYEDTRAAAAELRRNWNALTMAVASAVSSNAELATLAAAEARNATLTDDAARWQWIVGARTEDEATACVLEGPPPVLPQDEVISTLGGWYFHKELADSLVDAAMARAVAMNEKSHDR